MKLNKFLLLIFTWVLISQGQAIAGSSLSDQIKSMCSAKWGTKYSMVKFCIDRESVAARDVARLQKTTPKEILNPCLQKWGIKMSMVKFCIDRESRALNHLGTSQDSISPEILIMCRAKWGDKYSMVKFCAEREQAAKETLER